MKPDYYREYFRNEREHWWFQARETILRGQIIQLIQRGVLPSRPKILNIGAATGRSSEWLGAWGEVTSLEYDGECCRLTREATGLEVVEGSILDLPFEPGVFDLVCAFDVIEHVVEDQVGVTEMKRVCRGGGVVFVTVPAFMFLWGEHDEINQHQRRYRLAGLREVFGADGKILRSSYFNTWLFPMVAAVRLLRKSQNSASAPRSDFSRDRAGYLSSWLRWIFGSERHALERDIRLPFGVSALLQWQKARD